MTKRVAVGALVLALAPVLAFSQGNAKSVPKDLKPEIVKCANASTSLKRLDCFDALIKKLGIEIPKEGQIAATSQDPPKPRSPQNEEQAGRFELIQELVQKGAFSKVVKPGSVPEMWITPAFYALDFDVKSKFAALVWEYYFKESKGAANIALLYDSKTGKRVGSFSDAGLRMD